MDGSGKESDNAQKRTALEDLNKEDLVKKCKNLLVIAQRAKQAKDEATEEIKRLKEQLNALQLKCEKVNSKETNGELEWKDKEKQLESKISTMEEMLNNLTDKKLQYTMEADSLKKQNLSLEKQLKQFKIDEAKLKESSLILKAQIDELETAVESYKRQNNRLSDENEALIQEMETLESEMRKKEAQLSGSNFSQMKELEVEIQVLRDELDCLKQENSRKKEQMKQLFENFSKEKSELESKLEEEQNKKNKEVQNLIEELRTLSFENERILTDIKNVKKNNSELQKLIEIISSERDAFNHQCIKLNEERKLEKNKFELLESEKKSVINSNVCLEEEKCRLNELLENCQKEIGSITNENNLLKDEKEELNEKLQSLLNEREKLNSELDTAECQLLNILHQLVSILQENKVLDIHANECNTFSDKQSNSLQNLISLLNEKLAHVLLLANVNIVCSSEKVEYCCQRKTEKDFNLTEDCSVTESEIKCVTDVNLQARDYFTKLYAEITLLDSVISNLETQGELLHSENLELKNTIALMKKDNASDLNIQTNSMPGLDENICTKTSCVCCSKITQLTMELESCKNNSKLKSIELENIKVKCELDNSVYCNDMEEELRKELNHCRQCLSQKNIELNLVQEELALVLGKQKEFGELQRRKMGGTCKETLQSNRSVEKKELEIDQFKQEILKLQEQKCNFELEINRLQAEKQVSNTEIENMTCITKNLEDKLANLNTNIKIMQQDILVSKETISDLESSKLKLYDEKVKVEKELDELKKELLIKSCSVEERSAEVNVLKNKLSEHLNSQADMNIIVERFKREVEELKQQLTDKCLILNKCNNELQTLKEINGENKKLQNYICKLKKEIDENSKKELEIRLLKADVTKLTSERKELNAELEIKSKFILEKEAEIQVLTKKLSSISSSLEVIKSDLEDKILKFENEAQNLRFLFDEKNIELNLAKDEIRTIKENSVVIPREKFVEISELQSSFKAKDNELETLRTTLLKAESNLAQTLVKLSESEAEYLNLQNFTETLKEKISELNLHLEEKTCELSKLQLCIDEKCSEISNISKNSQDTITEIEELRKELKQCQLDQTKTENILKNRLLESQDSYKVYVEKLNSVEIQKEQFQNDFKALQVSYTEKTKQLENMQSQCHDFQEKLKVSDHQYDKIKNDVDNLKKELKLSYEENQKVKEELKIAKTCYDDKVKELENLSSELVNVENASAEAFGRLTAMTVELDSVKELNMTSTRKLSEMSEELKDVTANLKIKEAALQEKLQELEECKKTNEFLNLKTENTKTGLEMIMLRISELKDIRSKLSEDILSLKSSVLSSLQQDTWLQIKMIIESFVQAEIAIMKKENAELLGEMNEMNQVLKQRGETISKLKEMYAEQEHQLKESNSKIDVIQEDLKSKLSELESNTNSLCDLEMTLAKLKESHQEDILVKESTIKSLQKEVTKFKECQHELETKTLALEAKEESIHNLEAELAKQTEKLQELETKNKIISDLQNKIEKLEETDREERKEDNEIKVTDDQKVKIKELQDEVSSLKIRIHQLEREAEEMHKENGDAPSEIMSSSTISKAEESARLKDIEETFEERYTKLRIVAVRLKKRVSELTAQQTQLEADKKKLVADKSELQAKVTQLSAHAKNLQTMQQEYDRLQDELESQKTEVKQLTKTLEAAVNESASVKIQLQECQQEKESKVRELEIYSKDKQTLNAAIKDLMSQVQTLKKEKDIENIDKKEKEKEIRRLEEELKTMEKKLADEVDQHKNTQEQLEIRKQECKKRSVLSLEMEDYERSVAELTQQLTAEKSKVKELESHLETQRDISRGLQEQISLLEQRIQSEEARSKEVKDQLNISRTKLSELEAHAQEHEVLIIDLTSQIEHHREKSENLVLQLSELAAEKQRLVESGRNQQDELTRQMHVLEEYVSRLKESLAERETELGDLRADFVNYKVRAQSVLRQKARPEEGTSTFSREDCMEELSQLRQTADILRTKLEDASAKLQTLTVENSAIQEDRTRVLQRCQELVDTVQDLRSQNSQLQTQLEEMATEHREAIKSHKLQAETLNQCYKQQLEELEDCLQKETTLLKKQLEEAEKQMHGLEQQSSSLGDTSMQLSHAKGANVTLNSPNNTHWSNSGTGFVPVSPSGMNQQENENRLEISLLEREEGEGSESVDSVSPHLNVSQDHRTELVPLDKLLSSSSEDDVVPSTVGGSPSMEIGRTKEQLVMSECRIRHLTGLLSEAERDLAKLTQQNQVLKEEIRRQQRSVEREQHAQNFEYLKNVVLKFVTLQGGDERSRLVPVLNTILKLSPEETNQLNIVAKGGPELQGGGKGWSSYLSLWSGTQ